MRTWEMIKALTENPELKFKVGNFSAFVDEKTGLLKLTYLRKECNPSENIRLIGANADRWELVREPVDFMTTINSGKPISTVDGTIRRCNPDYVLSSRCFNLTLSAINNKWYIE